MTSPTMIGPCSPFFIVSDIAKSLAHYVDALGFTCQMRAPEPEPFFAIVARGSAQIMLKVIGEAVPPAPNPVRHEWARWDTFIYAEDPAALAAEFSNRQVTFVEPLGDDEDGLTGFAVADPDGYVCYFGRPS